MEALRIYLVGFLVQNKKRQRIQTYTKRETFLALLHIPCPTHLLSNCSCRAQSATGRGSKSFAGWGGAVATVNRTPNEKETYVMF